MGDNACWHLTLSVGTEDFWDLGIHTNVSTCVSQQGQAPADVSVAGGRAAASHRIAAQASWECEVGPHGWQWEDTASKGLTLLKKQKFGLEVESRSNNVS